MVTDRLAAFVVRVAVFVLVVAAVDYALTLFNSPSDSVFALITAEKQPQVESRLDAGLQDVDVVALGSSRAQFAFVPEVFARVAGTRSYNAGVGGFLETSLQYDLLRRILRDGRPKMIIYVIDDIALNAEPLRERNGQILQVFRSVRMLRRGLHRAFNAMANDGWRVPAFKKGELNLEPFERYDGYTVHADGWVEGKGVANTKEIRHQGMTFSPSPDAVVFLRKVIDLCREHAIPIVLVQAPTHAVYLKSAEMRLRRFAAFMDDLAAEYGILYLDFANSGRFPSWNANLFFDTSHLNSEGARLFSRILAEDLFPHDARGPAK